MSDTGKDNTFVSPHSKVWPKDSGVSGVDATLNWAAGNHLMAPTEAPGIPKTLDPSTSAAPGVSGVDSDFEKEAASHLRQAVKPR